MSCTKRCSRHPALSLNPWMEEADDDGKVEEVDADDDEEGGEVVGSLSQLSDARKEDLGEWDTDAVGEVLHCEEGKSEGV